MTPLQKKICMVGSFGVGKTSLVRRTVESIFDDRYLTNIGVRIDKKNLTVGGQAITLVLWDLVGEDEISKLRQSHLRGASGYILVADGSRSATLEKAVELHRRIREPLGNVPFVLAVNKVDLRKDWEIKQNSLDSLTREGWRVFAASAKTGEGVEALFRSLAEDMLTVRG